MRRIAEAIIALVAVAIYVVASVWIAFRMYGR